MRPFFILFLLAFFYHSNASNDTLTRAEIYNFSVGDTFDYSLSSGYYGYGSEQFSSYERYIISTIYWSLDSSTKFIIQKEVYPTPISYDTIQLINGDGFEVIMDSTLWGGPECGPNYYQIDSLPDYFNQLTNYNFRYTAGQKGNDCGIWGGILFARGIGKVIDVDWAVNTGVISWDSTILIYYSGANGTFGEPYTSFPTSVENLTSSNEQLKVYPTLNNGTFTTETPGGTQLPLDFFVYDLRGILVRQLVLNQSRTEVNLQGLSSGFYIWKTGPEETILSSGKIIIE